MRVLFLTCHLPWPPVSGGRLREHELLRRLGEDCELHVCAVTKTYEQDLGAAARLEGCCASVAVFEARPGARGLPAQARRHCSGEAEPHVRALLGDVDLVHVEGFYLLHLVPERCPVPVLLIEQNVEFSLWEQRVTNRGAAGGVAGSARRSSRASVSACRTCACCSSATSRRRRCRRSRASTSR